MLNAADNHAAQKDRRDSQLRHRHISHTYRYRYGAAGTKSALVQPDGTEVALTHDANAIDTNAYVPFKRGDVQVREVVRNAGIVVATPWSWVSCGKATSLL